VVSFYFFTPFSVDRTEPTGKRLPENATIIRETYPEYFRTPREQAAFVAGPEGTGPEIVIPFILNNY
jgi:hypothetical protein